MRLPTSAFENRTHGAEKIGPSRYSDFFNRITRKRTLRCVAAARYVASYVTSQPKYDAEDRIGRRHD
jgi:hypothetical protein